MPTDVTVRDGIPEGDLRAAWESLLADDPDATIFHTPRYLEVWHRELGQHTSPRVRVVHDGSDLLAVIPESRELEGSPTGPREVIRFLGGSDVTDYLGPISRRGDRDRVAEAYLRSLTDDRDWDEFVAEGLSGESGWVEAFSGAIDGTGTQLVESALEDVCPRIDLRDGYDEYLQRLGGKQRHELRRKGRKLARDAGEVQLVDVPPSDLEKGLDGFFDMVTDGEDDKSRFFMNDAMRSFFFELAAEFGEERVFRLHQLNVAGAPGAATISFVHGGAWLLYNSAFDESLRRLAPGMVLVSELIRVAAEDEGCTEFDLLRGDEPYKYRFGAEDRDLRRFTLVRGG